MRKKHLLIAALVCLTIAGIALYALGVEIHKSYECTSISGTYTPDLFGPKPPGVDWDHEMRFKHQPWKKTTNI